MSMKERIRARMDELGLDPMDLAVRMKHAGCECAFHNAYNWYHGRSNPRAGYVPYIADALGVSINDLFGVQPEPATAAAEE
jgi:transcriptional regulator with XRE-family HTH domain